ncbi:MAG TPA: RNase A-like domain-containing protein [Vicinamibacterales bacterium]
MRGPLSLVLVALTACAGSQPGQAPRAQTASAPAVAANPPEPQRRPTGGDASPRDRVRDLSVDESMGGHTLTRHVGRTDAELAERLRREPQISAASTWTDRDTAERAVGASLASADGKLTSWERRSGRRPNLVLHYTDRSGGTLGRSLSRGHDTAVPCTRALVVLKWDERWDRFYVLTAYPEADR